MRNQFLAQVVTNKGIKINFRLHPRAVSVVIVIDSNQWYTKAEIAFDKRRNLATSNFRSDQCARLNSTRELKQTTTPLPVIPLRTRVRLFLLISVNAIPGSGSVLNEPKVACHVREAHEMRHVVSDINDHHGH